MSDSQSRIEELLNALITNGTTDLVPQTEVEIYLKACIDKTGTSGLPAPTSRMTLLLKQLADELAGGGSSNLLQEAINVVKQSGEDVGLLAQPYSLGLTAGATYSVTHKYLGESYTQSTTAAEIPFSDTETIVALGTTTGEDMTLPIGNDEANGGIIIYDNFGLNENQEPVVQENSFLAMAAESVEIDTIAQTATPEPDEPDEPTVDGNLLTAPVSFNSMAMTDTSMPQIDYSLGLKLDNTYTINVTIDGETLVFDDQPGIPSAYPNSTSYYGGVTLGNLGGEAIMGNTNSIVYDPNKTSFMCMVMNGDDGTPSTSSVTINSIVLKTTVPDERLTAPVTIPAQSTSNITGLTVQGELNLGTEATIDNPNPSVLYKIEGTIGGQDFTSFLMGGYSGGQYYPFGVYGTRGGGATACDDGLPVGTERPYWQCGITGIAMNASWSGTDFVAATGSWAIRVEALVSENTIIRGTPEIVINSIKRMNLPNILTADIEMSNHVVSEDYTTPYYGEATKPEGVSLEAGARYILVISTSTSQDRFCATGVAKADPTINNCITFEGYSAYSATATNKSGEIYVVDGALYKAPTDETQKYDPTKWTFGAVVKEPAKAFYLAKVE